MKILFATMKMDIGGVETHVLELSKELARRGHEIVVTSYGGVFEKELEENGIKHVTLPLHNKRPENLMKSYFGLKKLIKEGNFDLVHSHARIPSTICGMLQKRLKFRFVTSAHWVFKVNFILRILTNWGERTIAVSDDIRKYLIHNYNVPKKNITTTINGIDTDKFSSSIDYSDIAKEFDFGKNKLRIVYISRIDLDRSAVAFHLLNVAKKLHNKFPNIEIVVVGGGNDYERLKEKAAEVNKGMREKLVITTGSRTDINKFIASADIFIGVSRAVLEAMSAEKPVIIAGNEGYIGTFTKEKYDIAVKTNFCCRDCEAASDELLYADITALLRLSKEKSKALGVYNREVILNSYSAAKMADDCLSMYKKLLAFDPFKKDEIVLSGYYGFNNSGDDAILKTILKGIKSRYKNIGITVFSNKPTEVTRVYKVNSVSRWNIFSMIRALKNSKLFISGGGSIIQDVTSTKSLIYYLALIVIAKMFNNKVMLYANGIGPINKKRNRKFTKEILNKVDVITLREEDSQDMLNELGIINPKTFVTCDPVIGLEDISEEDVDTLLFRYGLLGKKYIVVSLRDWKTISAFEDGLLSALKEIKEKHCCELLFLPMQYPLDVAINKKFAELTNSLCYDKRMSAEMTIGIVKKSVLAIGMRLHLLIYAFTASTPSVGIAYDPKVESVMKYFGQDTYLGLLEFTKLSFTAKVDRIIQNMPEYKENLATRLEDLKEKNKKNIELVIKLLEDN